MKHFIFTLALCISALNINGQVIGTIYFDKDNEVSNQDDYFYRRVITQKTPKSYQINDFYHTDTLKLTVIAITKKNYNYNSIDWQKLGYNRDTPIKLDGEWLSYYPSGKRKSKRIYAKGEIQESLNYDEASGETIYFIIDQMPEFVGGEEALRKFIAMNVKYPVKAQKNGVQGRVYISFVVDKQGKVKNCSVARGVNKDLNKEAMRVVGSLPKWKPGIHKGKKVNVSYTVPINFVLTR